MDESSGVDSYLLGPELAIRSFCTGQKRLELMRGNEGI